MGFGENRSNSMAITKTIIAVCFLKLKTKKYVF